MFAAMRSRPSEPRPPCPCGGTCRCHRPAREVGIAWMLIPAAVLLVFGVGIPMLVISLDPPRERHIRVEGRDCVVRFVETGHRKRILGTSRYGYDEAVCPPAVSSSAR